MRKSKLTEERKAKIPKLRQQGCTMAQIAKALGVSQSCVTYWSNPEKYRKQWNEVTKRWNKNNPERLRERSRDFVRTNYVAMYDEEGRQRKVRVVGKKQRPDRCELCGSETKRLVYHHWDNNMLLAGLWLCNPCHFLAEGVDANRVGEYLQLKEEADASARARLS